MELKVFVEDASGWTFPLVLLNSAEEAEVLCRQLNKVHPIGNGMRLLRDGMVAKFQEIED